MTEHSNSEVDLIKLLINWTLFLRKRKAIIVSFFVIATIIETIKIVTNPFDFRSYYQKNFVIETAIVSTNILQEIIKNLELKVNDANTGPNDLAKELGVSQNVAKQLRNVETETPAFIKAVEPVEPVLYLKVEVYDASFTDSLVEGIKYYINSNDYVKKRYELTRQQDTQLIAEIDKQVFELYGNKTDNLQPFQNNSVMFNIYKKSELLSYIELTGQKLFKIRELILTRPIMLIDSNAPSFKKNNILKNILKILLVGSFGAFTGVVLGLSMNIYSKIVGLVESRKL